LAAAQPPMLVLGAFEGAMTPHTRIPLDRGICGAAAASGKTVVVDDVSEDPRYLACSIETKSEIVVPVFAHGKVVGSWISTVTFRPPSARTTVNWWNTAPGWWADILSSRGPESLFVARSGHETGGCGLDYEGWQGAGMPAHPSSDHALEVGISRRK